MLKERYPFIKNSTSLIKYPSMTKNIKNHNRCIKQNNKNYDMKTSKRTQKNFH